MKTIEYLPHIADMRLRIEADSLEELFEAGLKGMAQILKKDFCFQHTDFDVEYTISIEAADLTLLLVDFLSEILTQSYIETVVFCELEVAHISENKLTATVQGKKTDAFDTDVKAITYHEADVQRNHLGNWETYLIFDI
ncbi:MAG: archease [Chitinophagales bacterium]|nr:MAG: archease [Chitinophagales bacterium]